MPCQTKQAFLSEHLPGRQFGLIVAAACLFFMTGCVSAPLNDARNEFYSGKPAEAVQTLSDTSQSSSRDKLLFYMEKGLILHHMGDYDKSSKEFLKAANLVKRQDYVSVSEQSVSLVTSEWATSYKGEYSERLWIHSYQMMNFLLMYKPESAAIEARRALKVLKSFETPLKSDYFTQALIGLSFESMQKYNDAFIEYKKLAMQFSSPAPLAWELYRLARLLGISEQAEKYKSYIPTQRLNAFKDKSFGELIIFASSGRSPKKIAEDIVIPPSARLSMPKYQNISPPPPEYRIVASSRSIPYVTNITTDIFTVASASLDDRSAGIITKQALRAGTKEVLSQVVDNENDVAGIIIRGIFFLMEEADTRSWETLPANLTLIRVPLKPGTHQIKVSAYRSDGFVMDSVDLGNIRIRSGQLIFRKVRF